MPAPLTAIPEANPEVLGTVTDDVPAIIAAPLTRLEVPPVTVTFTMPFWKLWKPRSEISRCRSNRYTPEAVEAKGCAVRLFSPKRSPLKTVQNG